jgi:hypothetical protein
MSTVMPSSFASTGANRASNIRKAFGMQDVVVGFKQFDDDFIIQGNDERKLKALFHNDLIRRIISWQPHIQLWNEVDDSFSYDDWGQGVSELRFEVVGVIMDSAAAAGSIRSVC